MARQRTNVTVDLPACYAIVLPGLEALAGEEIEKDLKGEVRKITPGVVVFRIDPIDASLLTPRTTEDVYLLAWGSDELTYRATDLELIERWTARADWPFFLRIHQGLRPDRKGKPTFRLVTQMQGKHGYLRKDAGKALARGLARHIPPNWTPAEENAQFEFWLTIDEATAVCGLRLSDRTMRHRAYKMEHRPASLRPTLAAAMVRLAGAYPGQVVIDPLCGAGTILAEQLAWADRYKGGIEVRGGEIEFAAVKMAALNLKRIGAPFLCQWDARGLPLADASVDHIVTNPPFGKQLSSPEAIGPLYRHLLREFDRVLRPGGQAVLLVSEPTVLREAAGPTGWRMTRQVRVRVLGQSAQISAWRKPA